MSFWLRNKHSKFAVDGLVVYGFLVFTLIFIFSVYRYSSNLGLLAIDSFISISTGLGLFLIAKFYSFKQGKYFSWGTASMPLPIKLREPLINSMRPNTLALLAGPALVETLTFWFILQGGSRREWRAPLASGPTLQGDRKGASRLGLSALAHSLRYATRPIAKAWDLRDAPRDHRQSDSNSTHQRINQRFLSYQAGYLLIGIGCTGLIFFRLFVSTL